jgi:hypothetical protein
VEHHAFRCHSSDLHAALNAEKLCAGGSPCWKAAGYPKQEAFSPRMKYHPHEILVIALDLPSGKLT